MNVVLFHPTLLPPKDYGGVERVVLWLAKGLIELGHRVSVAAYPGSILPPGVQLIPIDPQDRSATAFVKRIPKGTEIVHFMAPPEEECWPLMPCSGLLTVHGNGKPDEKFPKNTVFLSQDHARRHGRKTYVHNGVDPSEYVFDPKGKDQRYLFLSKTSWKVKNLAGAMSLASQADVQLRIAGGNRPYGLRLRSLFSSKFEWVGPVTGKKKADILSRARALIFPVRWPEPFGLVVVEALMSGTPVIAPPIGSLPELIPSEVGKLIELSDVSTWISTLRAGLDRDPEACRSFALSKFHYHVMTQNYVSIYQRCIRGEEL